MYFGAMRRAGAVVSTSCSLRMWGRTCSSVPASLPSSDSEAELEQRPFSVGKLRWETPVNREKELGRLFALNVKNNWAKGSPILHKYTIPISTHLYGTWDTSLAHVYVDQLRNETVKEEVRRQLKEVAEGDDELVRYGEDQLEAMNGGGVKEIHIEADRDTDRIFRVLADALSELLGKDPVYGDTKRICKSLTNELRKIGPVFLSIDRIGDLSFLAFHFFRDELAKLFTIRSDDPSPSSDQPLYPLHVYFCGEASRICAASLAQGGHSDYRPKQEVLPQQPINASQIQMIVKEDYKGLSISDDVCGDLERVTGGPQGAIRQTLDALANQQEQQKQSSPLAAETVILSWIKVDLQNSRSADIVTTEDQFLLELLGPDAHEQLGVE